MNTTYYYTVCTAVAAALTVTACVQSTSTEEAPGVVLEASAQSTDEALVLLPMRAPSDAPSDAPFESDHEETPAFSQAQPPPPRIGHPAAGPPTPAEAPAQPTSSSTQLFEMLLEDAQELVAVVPHPSGDPRLHAYVLGRGSERWVWYRSGASGRFPALEQVAFSATNPNVLSFVAHTPGGQKLLVSKDGQTWHASAAYTALEPRLEYGARGDRLACRATQASENRASGTPVLLRFTGDRFAASGYGASIEGLGTTPDGEAVQFHITQGRQVRHGIEGTLYDTQPAWNDLGARGWVFYAKRANKWEFQLRHQVIQRYDTFKAEHWFVDGEGRVQFVARRDAKLFVGSISGTEGEDTFTEFGPCEAVEVPRSGVVRHHENKRIALVVTTLEGQVLLTGADANRFDMAGPFERVRIYPEQQAEHVVGIGTTGPDRSVLIGGKAHASFLALSTFLWSSDHQHLVYVGKTENGQRVVYDGEVGPEFTEVSRLVLTRQSQLPLYVGSGQRRHQVVRHSTQGTPVDKIDDLVLRNGDEFYYRAQVDGKPVIGVSLAPIEMFDRIRNLTVTRSDLLWYDGYRENGWYRVIETAVGQAYQALGPVHYPGASRKIVYAARTATRVANASPAPIPSPRARRRAPPGTIRTQTHILVQHDREHSFTRSYPDNGRNARLLGDTTQDLPQISVENASRAYRFRVRADEGLFVGLGTERFGPYQDAKRAVLSRDRARIYFAAKKDDGWHLVSNGEEGAAFTDVSEIMVAPDDRTPVYAAGSGRDKVRIVGTTPYLQVKDIELLPDRSGLLYTARTAEGWHVVQAATPSPPVQEVLQRGLLPDGKGIWARVRDGRNQRLLIRPSGGLFTMESAYKSVGAPTFYPNEAELGNRQRYRWSYPVQVGRRKGVAYAGQVVDQLTGLHFTIGGRLLGQASKQGRPHILLNDKVGPALDQIVSLAKHPQARAGDPFFFTERKASGTMALHRCTTLDECTSYPEVSAISEARWLEAGPTIAPTIYWAGLQNGDAFQALNSTRFDRVSDLQITENQGRIGAVVEQGGLKQVFVDTEAGPAATDIQELAFVGTDDLASYRAVHRIARAEVTDATRSEQMVRWVVGSDYTEFFERLIPIERGSALSTTKLAGRRLGSWRLYAGNRAITEPQDRLAGWCIQPTEAPQEGVSGLHFLAARDGRWTEYQGAEAMRSFDHLLHTDWDQLVGFESVAKPNGSIASGDEHDLHLSACSQDGRLLYTARDKDTIQLVFGDGVYPLEGTLQWARLLSDQIHAAVGFQARDGIHVFVGPKKLGPFDELRGGHELVGPDGGVAFIGIRDSMEHLYFIGQSGFHHQSPHLSYGLDKGKLLSFVARPQAGTVGNAGAFWAESRSSEDNHPAPWYLWETATGWRLTGYAGPASAESFLLTNIHRNDARGENALQWLSARLNPTSGTLTFYSERLTLPKADTALAARQLIPLTEPSPAAPAAETPTPATHPAGP